MAADKKKYEERMQDINDRAGQMRTLLLESVTDPASGDVISDSKVLNARYADAVKDSVYESAGESAPMILGTHARALHGYIRSHKRLPSDEMLASAHSSIENALNLTAGRSKPDGFVLESAEMSTTQGIMMRDRMIALILPVMLNSITSEMVTFVPGDYNQSEMFKIHRIAGSTFGDLTKGDRIDYTYNGRYSVMDQRKETGTGNGTKTGSAHDFKLDTNVLFSKVYPLKRKSVRILHDHDVVGFDNGSGSIFGTFKVGATTVNVTGTVDYSAGTVDPIFSVAPANGIKIDIGYDVDIEKDPTLIPRVDHEMESSLLYPHESAISCGVTLQALWGLRREYNLNADNMAMSAMRNLLSKDKDSKILRDLYYFAKGSTSWVRTVPDQRYFQEHYETLKEALLGIDTLLKNRTGISGLVGLVADPKAANLFKAMKDPFFQADGSYRSSAQPARVGRIFGMWDLYEDPNATAWSALCYGKGSEHGQAGYVAGDAIPAMSFKHPVLTDLKYQSTLWELAYRDINPFAGREYFTTLNFTTA